MIFLPIAGRELRVAARKPATFWVRMAAALAAVIISAGAMTVLQVTGMGVSGLGEALFGILTWMSLFAALSAGLFFTSDCLSEERREGTLGFLFLTDLRGYDVAAGKLLATSLRAAYALLTVFPILAATLLMGGVTGAQFWKTALALVNALFCSLAAGLLVSAISRDSQKAMGATFLALLLLAAGGPLSDAALGKRLVHIGPLFSLSSPFYVFATAGDFGPSRSPYWMALLVSNLIGWAMFAAACALVPRTWQDKGRRGASGAGWAHSLMYGGARRRIALRRKLLGINPVLWLLYRERWQFAGVWVVVLLLAGVLVAIRSIIKDSAGMYATPVTYLGLAAIYLWTASQACRFFNEGRRNGFIELLLTTPVRSRQMVRSQWRAQARMFGLPVLVLLSVEFWSAIHWNAGMAFGMGANTSPWVTVLVAGLKVVVTIANLIALSWFGMWMGMTSRSGHIATLKTIVFVQVIPWLAINFATFVGTAFLIGSLSKIKPSAAIGAWFPVVFAGGQSVLALVKDSCFFVWAKHQLRFSFQKAATRAIAPVPVARPIPRPPISTPPVIPAGA